MEDLIKLVKEIGNFIADAFDFLLDLIADIVYMIELTAKSVSKIPDYFDWLPASIVGMIVAIFAIVVIYKVLGREG